MQNLCCTNMRCLRLAAEELSIPFEKIDEHGNYLILKIKNKKYHFVYWSTPFNSTSISRICVDKDFTHKYLLDVIDMPKSKSYLNPYCRKEKRIFAKFNSIEEIAFDIKSNFKFPIIVKMNSGSLGKNVFLCKKENEIIGALKKIYNKRQSQYDYIALAQEFIKIKKEFRVIWFRGEILFVYEKICKIKKENLSPLHNPGSKVKVIKKNDLIYKKIKRFLLSAQKLKDFEFCGFDIALDDKNNLKMLELNAQPGFAIIADKAGDGVVINMYKEILKKI